MRLLIHATLIAYVVCDTLNLTEYNTKRAKIQRDESLQALGGNISLTDDETIVNNCLMRHKFNELDYSYQNPQYFNFSRHFFNYKDKMKSSKVYKIIKAMPKGAVLHCHDMALLDADYYMNVTYMDNLYVCFQENIQFKFANSIPQTPCDSAWQLLSEVRRSSPNVTQFDNELRKRFTIVVSDPDIVYPSIKETWTEFVKYFGAVNELITFRPIWEQYFYDALKKFRDDNIVYVEVRTILPILYELDGTIYDQLITAKACSKIIKRFKKNYPDFIGAKIIFAPSRKVDRAQLAQYLQIAHKVKANMPEFFAGFDLVGQEDNGNPLIEFIPELVAAKEFNYFFHAGETDWLGTLTDENLIDAILLGAKRIGHAYALAKHPALMKMVVENDIALEINVISNAVLSLVRDVRNHPMNIFLANGLPVVISSDDPGAWEAEPLTDDFYVGFVGVASKISDLRLLKTLALNSLKYSAMEPAEKVRAIVLFNNQWDEFVHNFDCRKY